MGTQRLEHVLKSASLYDVMILSESHDRQCNIEVTADQGQGKQKHKFVYSVRLFWVL